MRVYTVCTLCAILFLAGCATTGNSEQSQVKRITPEELQKLIPQAVAPYTLEQLITDSKLAKTPVEIIGHIQATDSRYDLNASKLLELHQQGVDTEVLNYIQQSNELAKQNYIADEINKAEKEKAEALRMLKAERMMQMRQFYNPFWHPYFGPYGYSFRHWPGSRFGWGMW
jgi:hypothetical protein